MNYKYLIQVYLVMFNVLYDFFHWFIWPQQYMHSLVRSTFLTYYFLALVWISSIHNLICIIYYLWFISMYSNLDKGSCMWIWYNPNCLVRRAFASFSALCWLICLYSVCEGELIMALYHIVSQPRWHGSGWALCGYIGGKVYVESSCLVRHAFASFDV